MGHIVPGARVRPQDPGAGPSVPASGRWSVPWKPGPVTAALAGTGGVTDLIIGIYCQEASATFA